MLFWFIAALLTLGASLSVLLPLSARREVGAVGADHEILVYRDQLAEVERDQQRGLLPESEAGEARIEIGRRILKADRERASSRSGSSTGLARWIAACAVLFVPLVSWGVYAAVGSPDLAAQPLSARLSKPASESSVDELVARAEQRLRANPDDGRGWETLAPVYLRLERFDQAAQAFRNALRLSGSSVERELGLGEALVAAARGEVTAEAQAAFGRALSLDPANMRAQFRLASALAQVGKANEARIGWNAMLAALPADSSWREPVTQALAELDGSAAGLSPATAGPTSADVAAASAMPDGDRRAMIERMVSSLDEKLRAEPQNADGWQQLVRSYLVLGRSADAQSALARGRNALGRGSEAEIRLAEFARTLGVDEAKEP